MLRRWAFNQSELAKDRRFFDWSVRLDALDPIEPGWWVDQGVVHAGHPKANTIDDLFHTLTPWRKGPWCLAGVSIDSEWRSDMKWDRLAGAIDLTDRRVLDVGAGNGYFGWRMLEAGAISVVGCDPMALFIAQHMLIERLAGTEDNGLWMARLETLPQSLGCFDVAFSMGVLSHRRYLAGDHIAHLGLIYRRLVPGGELVLETLVVPEGFTQTGRWGDQVLTIDDRYARMKNVYALPSIETLMAWLSQAGFRDARVVDQSITTIEEQRATDWMPYQSLADGLSSDDAHLTIEGYPRPLRAVVTASR